MRELFKAEMGARKPRDPSRLGERGNPPDPRLSQGAVDTMPRAMRWLLWVLAAQIVVDLVVLLTGDPARSSMGTALEVGALLVDAGVVLMLARATELTRGLIRGAAFVGMAIDAWILLGGLTYAPRDLEGVLMVASSAGLVAASAVAWLVLGREDVKAWIFARWLRVGGHDAPIESAA